MYLYNSLLYCFFLHWREGMLYLCSVCVCANLDMRGGNGLEMALRVESSFQWHDQGVVTYTSPVEAFATRIKNLDRWKSALIAWLLRSEALDHLILWEFKEQNVATPAKYLRKGVDRLMLVAQNSSWSLDRLLKWTLIAWFNFDPGHKLF